MNDFFKILKTRRSIRKFSNKEVSKETILKIIEAGMFAPTAGNRQPWEFIVVDDKEIFDGIMEVHPHAQPLKTANKAIIICGRKDLAVSFEYMLLDLGAVTQNMLLTIHSEGLGACWLGTFPRENRMKKISEMCKLPENVIPFSTIALGFPLETPKNPQRFKEEKIFYNIYQK